MVSVFWERHHIKGRFPGSGSDNGSQPVGGSCIGLAIGAGFYWGALSATLLSYVTLVLLKKFEGYVPGLKDSELSLRFPMYRGKLPKLQMY